MNILLINDFKTGGGAEVIFYKTYQTLMAIGHNVDIVYCHEKIVSPKSIINYIFSIKKYFEIKNSLKKKNYNLIYILNYSNAYSPSILLAINQYKKRNPKLKVLYNAHDAHIICPNSALNYYQNKKSYRFNTPISFKHFILKRLDHRGAIYSIIKKIQWILAYKILHLQKTFDKILCPSLFLATQIQKTYPYLDTDILRNPLNKKEIEKPQNYNKLIHSPIRLIYFGRLSSEKGLNILLQNFQNVNIDYEFHIYGDGPDKESLQKLVNQLSLKNKIFFKGKLPWKSLMKIIHQYDAFILPSHCYENAPLSIVEAAYAGLYILTMNYGGMKEISDIVGNNLFINPISPETLTTQIMNIYKLPFNKPNYEMFSEDLFKEKISQYISSLK